MRKFQCLLFVLNQSYICYDLIYMTVPLTRYIYKRNVIIPIVTRNTRTLFLSLTKITKIILLYEKYSKKTFLKFISNHHHLVALQKSECLKSFFFLHRKNKFKSII